MAQHVLSAAYVRCTHARTHKYTSTHARRKRRRRPCLSPIYPPPHTLRFIFPLKRALASAFLCPEGYLPRQGHINNGRPDTRIGELVMPPLPPATLRLWLLLLLLLAYDNASSAEICERHRNREIWSEMPSIHGWMSRQSSLSVRAVTAATPSPPPSPECELALKPSSASLWCVQRATTMQQQQQLTHASTAHIRDRKP